VFVVGGGYVKHLYSMVMLLGDVGYVNMFSVPTSLLFAANS
jgi:hypothetical protein